MIGYYGKLYEYLSYALYYVFTWGNHLYNCGSSLVFNVVTLKVYKYRNKYMQLFLSRLYYFTLSYFPIITRYWHDDIKQRWPVENHLIHILVTHSFCWVSFQNIFCSWAYKSLLHLKKWKNKDVKINSRSCSSSSSNVQVRFSAVLLHQDGLLLPPCHSFGKGQSMLQTV